MVRRHRADAEPHPRAALRDGAFERAFGAGGADNLIATDYKLPDYINLVVGMLITFGLSFQLPLVVLALVRVGIVEHETLRTSRQYVYFAIAILACVITPGDYITGTVLLIGPLIALYELGVWLAREPKPGPGVTT